MLALEHQTPRLFIFSDLDGTLLDEHYDFAPARPALELCARRGAGLILVSSKTRAEMEPLRRRLKLTQPFICENGGGIFFPHEGSVAPPGPTAPAAGGRMWGMGVPYPRLRAALISLRRRLNLPLLGFGDLTIREIAGLTGLTEGEARLAVQREFDEPFLARPELTPPHEARLAGAIREWGLEGSKGGRFRHLHGPGGKARAVASLLSWLRKDGPLISLGLGDAPNDYAMLALMDYPVLLGDTPPGLAVIPEPARLRHLAQSGPQGWNQAVLAILRELEEP